VIEDYILYNRLANYLNCKITHFKELQKNNKIPHLFKELQRKNLL